MSLLLVPTKREAFMLACLRHLGEVVVWGQLDCSDLVARGELAVGLPNRRNSHTAKLYAATNPEGTLEPELGDLGFFGPSWIDVQHVVLCSFGRQVLSADGATRAITDPSIAALHPGSRVRLHPDLSWYRSSPFLGWRKHAELTE